MKKLLILLAVIMALALTGCLVAPAEPVEPVEFPIVCEDGEYIGYFSLWSFTGCEEDPWYAPGVYWFNEDGRVFLIGDNVYPLLATDVYGACPEKYIEEILK